MTGTLIGGGAGNLAGSSVSVSVSSGSYSVGALNSPGTITLANTDNSAGNGNISITGAVASTGSTIGVTSGSNGAISITAAGSVSTTAGNGLTLTGGTSGIAITGTVSSNAVNVSPGSITIDTTGVITLNNGALISAQSSGTANVASVASISLTGASFSFPASGLATVNVGSTAGFYSTAGEVIITSTAGDISTGSNFALLASAPFGEALLRITSFGNLTIGQVLYSAQLQRPPVAVQVLLH